MPLPEDRTPVADINSRENLAKLLNEMSERPDKAEEIKARINEIFLEERTVLILDLSGFTRATHRGDTLEFLLMINQMRRLTLPIIDVNNGLVVRADDDNLTCIFDSVLEAVEAAGQITASLGSANTLLPEEKELYVSIGIGYGQILNVENHAIYGNEVNLASKLGEDIAEQGEILMTEKAFERVKVEEIDCGASERKVNIAGIDLTYYLIDV
jgi:adenylate cyclase